MNKPNDKWYRLSGAEGRRGDQHPRPAGATTGVPFPAAMNPEQKQASWRRYAPRSGLWGAFSAGGYGQAVPRDSLSLVERHLISPEFARSGAGSALLLTEDEGIALMVNEEDHLRLQVMRPGLDLDGAYEQADRLDSALDEKLHFAFDQRLGYLTQCPTNLGTGMRASLMLHLPALQERGAIQQLAVTVSKLGLTIRGCTARAPKPSGGYIPAVQSSDAGNLGAGGHRQPEGLPPKSFGRNAPDGSSGRRTPHFEDMVWRSLGLLRTARLLTGTEFMALVSNLRLGIAMGVIPDIPLETAGTLINDVQPATLMVAANLRDMEPAEQDALRARTVRERLA